MPFTFPLAAAFLQAVTIPPPTALVNDFAGVISADQRTALERLAEAVRRSSPGEIAVVTLPDIGDRDPAEIALRIGREWGVGRRGEAGDPTRNAGVVILVVPKESSSSGFGSCRIEVGRGAEGFITDATAASICREATPAFVARDYTAAIGLLTARVAERFSGEFGFSIDSALAVVAGAQQQPARVPAGPPRWAVLVMIVVLIVLIRSTNRSRRRGRRRGRRGPRGGSGASVIPVPIFIPGRVGGGRGGFGGLGGGGLGGGGFGGFGGGGGFSGGGGGMRW